MARGNTDLTSNEYEQYLASKSKNSRSARQELAQRHKDKRNANDGYRGWHFGIGDAPVKCESKEHFKHELNKRGLMMRDEEKKNLK